MHETINCNRLFRLWSSCVVHIKTSKKNIKAKVHKYAQIPAKYEIFRCPLSANLFKRALRLKTHTDFVNSDIDLTLELVGITRIDENEIHLTREM